MKVNIYVTEEVSDEDRKQISQLLEVKQATRDQLKEFLWLHGANWRTKLGPQAQAEPDELGLLPEPAEADELESLL